MKRFWRWLLPLRDVTDEINRIEQECRVLTAEIAIVTAVVRKMHKNLLEKAGSGDYEQRDTSTEEPSGPIQGELEDIR